MDKRYIERLKDRAMRGVTPIQIQLGYSYLTGVSPDGESFPQDYHEARYWLEKAHQKGAYTATVLLGTIYEEGKGVDVDIVKAIHLYKNAADQGAYLPCIYLARIYANGVGVNKSIDIANEWYERALRFEKNVDDEGIKEAYDFINENKKT